MVQRIGAQIALLSFALAVLAGLAVGNPPTTILLRALAALFIGLLVGQFCAWTSKLVVRDHLLRRKIEIDRAHTAHMLEMNRPDPDDSVAEPS